LEKAVHILNTSSPNRVEFRSTAEEIVRQVFTPRRARTLDGDEIVDADTYERLEEAFVERDAAHPVEVSPWQQPPAFLSDIRDAALYGGSEFLELIIQAAEVITARNRGNLPDPIDPGSIQRNSRWLTAHPSRIESETSW
jgi:hypothetical protein